jgi:CBS domain-containing protein
MVFQHVRSLAGTGGHTKGHLVPGGHIGGPQNRVGASPDREELHHRLVPQIFRGYPEGDLREQGVREVMTPNPRTIRPNQLAVEAVQLMEEYKITQLLAVDGDLKLLGALNMHDLMRAKVI